MLRNTQCLVMLVLAAAGTASAAQNGHVLQSPLQPGALEPGGAWMNLEWDGAAYEAVRKTAQLAIPGFVLADGTVIELHLEQFDVLSPDAQLIVSDGVDEQRTERPDVVLLRGSVADAPGSEVFLGLSPLGSNGYIKIDDQMWIIATPPPHVEAPTVIYNHQALPEGAVNLRALPCGNERLPFGGALKPPAPVNHSAGRSSDSTDTECLSVRVAIETDWEYTSQVFSGNTTAAQAYAITLLGAVSEIYRGQLNVGLQVTFVRVWSTSNDPYNATTVGNRLLEFRQHWNTSMQGVERNIGHMLTGLQSGSGGQAWKGVLCDPSFAYGATGYINGSFPYPLKHNNTQNWDVKVVSHEIGHNFDAPHTHEVSPQIDGCGAGNCGNAFGGTIMSYCNQCPGGLGNIRLEFHPRIIDEHIRPYLDSIGCPAINEPVSIISHPASQGSLAGRTVEFTVNSTGTGPYSYQWMHNGFLLTNGGRISGATTSKLRIANVQPSDNGAYTARVNNVCSSAVSNAGNLVVTQLCYANCDGSTAQPILNIMDFICFIDHFAFAQSLPQEQQIQNYANCDLSTTPPVLNIDDFVCYINKFSAGCP